MRISKTHSVMKERILTILLIPLVVLVIIGLLIVEAVERRFK